MMNKQNPEILPPKQRYRWLLWLAASPFLLFAVLCVLLYLPPVQNFAVGKAAQIASESTGLDITVERIALSFPLDLVVKDVQAVHPEKGDTLLRLERLEVSVQMLPLLKQDIQIDGITLQGAEVHTGDFIAGTTVDGRLGELFLESHGVVFDPEKAVVNEFSIKDTDLQICLTDTIETPDTTATDTLYWKIDLQRIALENVSVALKMPHDSLDMRVSLASSTLKGGYIDLHRSAYSLRSFTLTEGAFAMDSTLHLQSIDLSVDSVYYQGRDIRATVSRFDVAEKTTGLEVLSTYAKV
ncbi:MAG: AsmA family protein, partial [Bacteroides sp.]|nr:AsmA family protein [Bacteroides sp.]